jgi:preprotein translocase subunit SecG
MTPTMRDLSEVVSDHVDAVVAFTDRHTPLTMAGTVAFIAVVFCVTLIVTAAINRSTRA